MAKTPKPPALFQFQEPDWTCIFTDELEIEFARSHWRIYLAAMRDAGTISEENLPTLQRLIVTEVLYDRAMKHIAEHGPVIEPRRKNSRSIARLDPQWTALRGYSADCTALSSELGLTPRSRGRVSPARRKANHAAIGGGYLKVVK